MVTDVCFISTLKSAYLIYGLFLCIHTLIEMKANFTAAFAVVSLSR